MANLDSLVDDVQAIKLDIGLLKRDANQIGVLHQKLDKTVDKLQELTSTISSMLPLHEERLKRQEITDDDLEKKIDRRKSEMLAEIKTLHHRIDGHKEEFSIRLDGIEERIMERIEELRLDNAREREYLEQRLNKIERYRWIAVGIILTLVFFVKNLNPLKTLFGF